MLVALTVSPVMVQGNQFDIPESNLLVPRTLAATSALRYDVGFHLTLDGTERKVASYNVRGIPAVSEESLEDVLKFGYFKVGGEEKEPILQWTGRILGGGVLTSPWPKPSPTFPTIEDLEMIGDGASKKVRSLGCISTHPLFTY